MSRRRRRGGTTRFQRILSRAKPVTEVARAGENVRYATLPLRREDFVGDRRRSGVPPAMEVELEGPRTLLTTWISSCSRKRGESGPKSLAENAWRGQTAPATPRGALPRFCERSSAPKRSGFGSLLEEPRHEQFDIDLAVQGLAPSRYFAALARVSEIADVPVDLVPLETCNEKLRQRIHATGIRLDDDG